MKLQKNLTDQVYCFADCLAFAWVLSIFFVFFIYPPYWALMDDASYWYSAKGGFEGMNLFKWLAHFTHHDFFWGMFRPLYALFIYVFYGAFWRSSAFAYLVIFIVNVLVFWTWSILFEKTLTQIFQRHDAREVRVYRSLFFIFCFLFSPNYTLFFFASLQERLILIFGSVSFFGMLTLHEEKHSFLKSSLLVISGIILALLSKATALFLIPCYALWLCILGIAKKKRRYHWLSVLLCMIGAGFGYFFLLIRRGYTADYQMTMLVGNFFHGGKRFYTAFWFAWAVLLAIAAFRWLRVKQIKSINLAPLIIWPAALLSYLTIMVPWRSAINYYLISPGGIFLVGCKLIPIFLLTSFVSERWRKLLIGTVLVICIGVSIPSMRKFILTARQHYFSRKVVEFLSNEIKRDGEDQLLVRMPPPCLEATRSMGLFISGRVEYVSLLDQDDSVYGLSSKTKKKLLVLNGECDEIPEKFSPRNLIFKESPWEVYELVNQS